MYREDLRTGTGGDSAFQNFDDQISYAYDLFFDNSRPISRDAERELPDMEDLSVFGPIIGKLEASIARLPIAENARQRRNIINLWLRVADEMEKLRQQL